MQRINARLLAAHECIHRLDCLMLTFGTSWVYEQKTTGHVVANCHKQPESVFIRRRLSVQEIVSDYTSLFSGLIARNPKLKVILTVSPIRHIRDGMHANQLSKATLLLAIDQLQASFPEHVSYFPAYELMLDELRDGIVEHAPSRFEVLAKLGYRNAFVKNYIVLFFKEEDTLTVAHIFRQSQDYARLVLNGS